MGRLNDTDEPASAGKLSLQDLIDHCRGANEFAERAGLEWWYYVAKRETDLLHEVRKLEGPIAVMARESATGSGSFLAAHRFTPQPRRQPALSRDDLQAIVAERGRALSHHLDRGSIIITAEKAFRAANPYR